MDGLLAVAEVVAGVGAAVWAGVFAAFSVMVMPALRRQSAHRGLAVMQAINRTASSPLFGLAFLLPALACAVVVLAAFTEQDDAGAALSLVGGLVYLAGAFVVTMAHHVPRNTRLSRLAPDDPTAAEAWRTYLSEWTGMNHVRAAAALAAAVLLVLGATS